MTQEQFFPTRWILNGVSREAFASHLRHLRTVDKQLAIKAVRHAYWVGVHPVRRNW